MGKGCVLFCSLGLCTNMFVKKLIQRGSVVCFVCAVFVYFKVLFFAFQFLPWHKKTVKVCLCRVSGEYLLLTI